MTNAQRNTLAKIKKTNSDVTALPTEFRHILVLVEDTASTRLLEVNSDGTCYELEGGFKDGKATVVAF